ncbi:MAG TPA: exosortase system-associated protein, TIGR04073 family [Candidatus Omnitrophota bacterium]|nr:exosortase system-associated protein, TIGR04073 family [Candidatus Omnitrophota bacterium]
MRKLACWILIVLLIPIVTLYAEDPFDPQGTRLRKLERGGANLLLGGMEMAHNLRQPDAGQFYPPWVVGLGKGFYYTGKRTLAGVYEVLTFPFPLPKDYLPVMEPEFAWEYPRADEIPPKPESAT